MTSKTSFFNKGIYKSTVKRYLWGSVLYFIILFFSTGLALFLNIGRGIYTPMDYNYYREWPLLFQGSYIGIPMLLAMFVPTVAALLIFRLIHSKKQAIFIHSLPASRKAIFNSSIAAGFTLMLVPVILNGIILMGISLCGYNSFFTVMDCFKWIGYNALGIFMMFSCAVFAANLTGNSFAMVALNGLIHGFLFLTVATFSVMAEVFVYGFTEINEVIEKVAESNFFVTVFGFSDHHYRENLTIWNFAEYIIASIAFYTVAYFLYKKRRIETVGDVAGFRCLNPIFKYVVTFLATMFGFAVFSTYISESPVVFGIIVVIISLVAYAASEMILKKTLNVAYSWKGYAIYAAAFAGLTCVFALTSFFGYETKIPEPSDVAEIAVYEYYGREEPYTSNEQIKTAAMDIHREFIERDIPIINEYGSATSDIWTKIHIRYKLKNGGTMTRSYPVSDETRTQILNRLYAYEDYRKLCEEIFMDDSRILKLYINNLAEIEEFDGLLEAIRKDNMSLTYEELYPKYYDPDDILYSVSIEYEFDEKTDDGKEYSYINRINVSIRKKYENTLKWIRENGYGDLNSDALYMD